MTLDDMATAREELDREIALRAQAERARLMPRLRPIGECHLCGETELPVANALFCCGECERDHGRKSRARQIAGGR